MEPLFDRIDTLILRVADHEAAAAWYAATLGLRASWTDAAEGLVDPERCDVRHLERIDARELSEQDLIETAERALEESRWAILAFRGVGAGEGAVDAAAHRGLCDWLADRPNMVRVAPVFEHARAIRERQLASDASFSWSYPVSEP